ncbi:MULTISPECIES: ABC transporter substrate-binding protein [unclassified Actinotalea]|uniref:ABC transporter substrate-binding protein n=1 Tax=unclassified Actinotalea TaxID=2638618 RepID=UPI0015F6A1D5|nr:MULTISPECIES: ABC transporter substrate-binding protein [unclassified Actinotalea]
MRRSGTARLIAAAVAALLLAGCAAGGTVAAPEATSRVEVFTWWASGSEKRGLDAVVGVFAAQHPDVRLVDGAVAGGAGTAAKDLLRSRLAAQDPPDTFQAHAGAELADYAEGGRLEDLSDLYDELGLRDVLPPELVATLTVDGDIYAVPSNIHRANVVWANPDVLAAAGLDPDATYASIDEWVAALETVGRSGVTPLAVGTTWTQVHLLETVLLAGLGAEAYTGLWDGTTDWRGPEVTAALEDFRTLLSLTNPDRDQLDWPDATQRVIDGQAAFTVMGDWALPAFEGAGREVGTGVVHFPVPGTDGVFDFLADSFTLPVGARNPDGARAWLETVASREGQTAFSRAKGSIPARTDADPADFGPYQRSAMASFRESTVVGSLTHGAVALATFDAVAAAVRSFTTGATDVAGLQAALAAAASTR